jgi:hypothetical protein
MNKVIRVLQWHLREENKKYGSVLVDIPESQWTDTMISLSVRPREVWRSSQFLVEVFPEKDGASRMSVCRTMVGEDGKWVDGISWDQLMKIKDQCGYGRDWAVEIFPSNDDVVNVANMRHLWLIPSAPAFAWIKDGN